MSHAPWKPSSGSNIHYLLSQNPGKNINFSKMSHIPRGKSNMTVRGHIYYAAKDMRKTGL